MPKISYEELRVGHAVEIKMGNGSWRAAEIMYKTRRPDQFNPKGKVRIAARGVDGFTDDVPADQVARYLRWPRRT